MFSTSSERIQSPTQRLTRLNPGRSASILCASSATSAVLNLKRYNTNFDNVPSSESRTHFNSLCSSFCVHGSAPKRMSVGASQHVRQSFNIREVLLTPLLEFKSLTPMRTLARAVPSLLVTGTQIPIGVRGHGIRTSSFA